ncbi:thioesterase family protein [Labrys monachus]|uniref:Acyl-CoA thioester hydrolase n=1 Tax=Labrys monachus TaxID=217067 RepID=A0ABU0FD29_9HYPH|nr:thioesterase family protein [Labrys monachus]MDQ0392512.1 acyl-CoA thioester hydrolase [Labrys monachus]
MHLLDETVRPEWIDYNGHLYDGYYAVIFARAVDVFVERIGLTAEVRQATRHTVYTLETHVRFLREVKLGAPLAVACQVLEVDAKRVRVFLSMRDTSRDVLAATSEQLLMSIDQGGEAPKSAPWLAESGTILAALAREDAGLPLPEGAGRSIAIKR